jgi:hypothetical protein
VKAVRYLCISLFFLLQFVSIGPAQAPRHPFIIVRESDYDSLRARSVRWPWSVMKAKAFAMVRLNSSPGFESYYRKALRVHDLGTACALARILDPSTAGVSVRHVIGEIRSLVHDLRVAKEQSTNPGDFEFNVVASHAVFMTYLVLDILYGDLDPGVRGAIESDCDYIADHQHSPWWESKYAIEGMRELYHSGPSEQFRVKKDAYKDYLMNTSSSDGVYSTGPGYAYSRLYMEERVQKKIFIDVCEFQGFHEFYTEPQLKNLYEWLFGYTMTPFNRTYTFGDTSPTKFFEEYSPALLRVGRFSREAQQFAYWYMRAPDDNSWRADLLQYLFCESPVFEGRAPASRIFWNGGAWLMQREYSPDALAGVLWNLNTLNETHSHYDANSVNIVGFGEYILRNSGYDNWQEPDSCTWGWIHRNAESSNTLTIGDANHIDFRGGGITEGIVGGVIEYACGTSGRSLTGGTHDRSLVFVQPGKECPGYFLLLDEVSTKEGESAIHLMLHPNSDEAPVVLANGQEYDWTIKNCHTTQSIHARAFLARPPLAVELKRGYKGAFDSCNRFSSTYLRASYSTDASGRAAVTTAIFAYRSGTIVPHASRISAPLAHGLSMSISDSVTDYILTSDQVGPFQYEEMSCHAATVFWREVRGRVASLFVRHGTKCVIGNAGKIGFESDSEVSLTMTGREVEIVCPGATVTLWLPEVRGATLDGNDLTQVETGKGFIRLTVPAGNHRIVLRTSS